MKRFSVMILALAVAFISPSGAAAENLHLFQVSSSVQETYVDGIDPLWYFEQYRANDYGFALSTAKSVLNKLKQQKYPYAYEAVCVVFPEMIRYSQFQDEIESLANELLAYATEESNGFSIGLFQMKPQFAAQMEKIISLNPDMKHKYKKIAFEGITNSAEARHDRIIRLRDMDLQIEYIKAFVDFEVNNLQLTECSREERIRYIATAYNAGFMYSKASLESFFTKKGFPTGRRDVYVNYGDICVSVLSKLK